MFKRLYAAYHWMLQNHPDRKYGVKFVIHYSIHHNHGDDIAEALRSSPYG